MLFFSPRTKNKLKSGRNSEKFSMRRSGTMRNLNMSENEKITKTTYYL